MMNYSKFNNFYIVSLNYEIASMHPSSWKKFNYWHQDLNHKPPHFGTFEYGKMKQTNLC
jgi:hypothetical protein